jgi:glycosyltransferase involved in cell wall biosynthesis
MVLCAQPVLDLEATPDPVPAEMEYHGIHIYRVPTAGSHAHGLVKRLVFATTYLLSTFAILVRRRNAFDGILVTTNPPFLGLVARVAGRIIGKPYVLLVHDVYPDIAVRLGVLRPRSPLTWLWNRFTRFMLNGADAVVVIGRDMADIVRGKLRRRHWSRMHLIPNWSDENVVTPTKTSANGFRVEQGLNGRMLVQYSGRLGATHNLEPLVEAAAILRDRPILFQFIGNGVKKRRLEQLVREKGLENVQFLPYQPRERLGEVLSAADLAVVCLESRFTGLSVPSKTYGVMASATAILAFLEPESEIGQTIRENDCGTVVPDPTGPAVADLIRKLLDDPDRLQRMGENGYRAFKNHYTLALAAQRYDHLLEQCFYEDERRRASRSS